MIDIVILFLIFVFICMVIYGLCHELKEATRPEDDLSGEHDEDIEKDLESF